MPIARQPSSCSKIDRMHDALPSVNLSAMKDLLRFASRPKGIREPGATRFSLIEEEYALPTFHPLPPPPIRERRREKS